MIKIQVEDTDEKIHEFEWKENPGSNLMEALTAEGMDIPAICGGMASCGTCHVTFRKGFEKLGPKEDDEVFMLDSLPNITDESRLSCQVSLTEDLDGAELKILNDG